MEKEYENVYGINFPMPQKVRSRTDQIIYSRIRAELLNILDKMERSSSDSIKLSSISSNCIDVLTKLGYKITLYHSPDESGYYYTLSWADDDGDEVY